MKKFLTVVVLIAGAAPLPGQTGDADARAAIAIASVSDRVTSLEVRVDALERTHATTDLYADAKRRALAENKPLLVWSGSAVCPACVHDTEGEFVSWVGTHPDLTPNAITVAVPDGGQLLDVATITNWVVSDPVRGHVPSIRRALARWRERREVTRGSDWTTAATWSGPTMQLARPVMPTDYPMANFGATSMVGYGQPMMMGGGGTMSMMGGGCATCGTAGRGVFRR